MTAKIRELRNEKFKNKNSKLHLILDNKAKLNLLASVPEKSKDNKKR